MVRVISIQRAYQIMNEIAEEFGVSAPTPPLFVTEHIPRKYAGVFESNSEMAIKIRPQYFTERVVSHEAGHWLFHHFRQGECSGDNPECESLARMVEQWWMAGRPRESKHGRNVVEFTLTRPISLDEAKEVASQLSRSEWGENIERVGFKDKKLYVVLKPDVNVDGIIIAPLVVIVAGILGLLGIGVVGWAVGLFAPGPLGLPVIAWIFIAGSVFLISLGWVVSKILK